MKVTTAKEKTSRTYRLDFKNKRVAGFVDGLEAVNQHIIKTILTPRYKCLIYDSQIGTEIKDVIIAQDATPEYIEAEIPRMLEDALLIDSRILSIKDYSFSFNGEEAHISVSVDTIFGETSAEVVL